MKHNHTIQVIEEIRKGNKGCNTQEYPETDNEEKCKGYWKVAEKEIKNQHPNLFTNFTKAHRIRVTVSQDEIIYCYNKKILDEKGWCNIARPSEQSQQWGICSPSCDKDFIQVFTPSSLIN